MPYLYILSVCTENDAIVNFLVESPPSAFHRNFRFLFERYCDVIIPIVGNCRPFASSELRNVYPFLTSSQSLLKYSPRAFIVSDPSYPNESHFLVLGKNRNSVKRLVSSILSEESCSTFSLSRFTKCHYYITQFGNSCRLNNL